MNCWKKILFSKKIFVDQYFLDTFKNVFCQNYVFQNSAKNLLQSDWSCYTVDTFPIQHRTRFTSAFYPPALIFQTMKMLHSKWFCAVACIPKYKHDLLLLALCYMFLFQTTSSGPLVSFQTTTCHTVISLCLHFQLWACFSLIS